MPCSRKKTCIKFPVTHKQIQYVINSPRTRLQARLAESDMRLARLDADIQRMETDLATLTREVSAGRAQRAGQLNLSLAPGLVPDPVPIRVACCWRGQLRR